MVTLIFIIIGIAMAILLRKLLKEDERFLEQVEDALLRQRDAAQYIRAKKDHYPPDSDTYRELDKLEEILYNKKCKGR